MGDWRCLAMHVSYRHHHHLKNTKEQRLRQRWFGQKFDGRVGAGLGLALLVDDVNQRPFWAEFQQEPIFLCAASRRCSAIGIPQYVEN